MAGGRKLEFDKQKALEAAMEVFWKKGYLGASLSDLTEGMGINKPSLYATFGNKEALFEQATHHYMETCSKPKSEYLFEPNTPLAQRIANYLKVIITGQCEGPNPKGCYISLCVAEAAGEGMPENALKTLNAAAGYASELFLHLFETDEEAIALGLNQQAAANARFVVTLMNGTAAMARAGTPYEELQTVIQNALRGLGL